MQSESEGTSGANVVMTDIQKSLEELISCSNKLILNKIIQLVHFGVNSLDCHCIAIRGKCRQTRPAEGPRQYY